MKRKAIIFDIDGTVALRGERDPYDMTSVGEDLPNEPVMFIARMIGFAAKVSGPPPVDVVFVSGRDESARSRTDMWLVHHFVYDFHLLMRRDGDNRPDDEVKQEILDGARKIWDIVAVFDDRNRVVDMWRANDITCFQVCSREDGNF